MYILLFSHIVGNIALLKKGHQKIYKLQLVLIYIQVDTRQKIPIIHFFYLKN